MQITDLLARRTDLSTFLVHLTRAQGDRTAKQNLLSIIETSVLRACSPFGAAVLLLAEAGAATDSQRCVCFTETPLEHVSLLTQVIQGRDIQFEPYGIAITRKRGRREGVNPVWYLDMTPGHDWLTKPIEELVKVAIKTRRFEEQPIARLAPFIDWMGVWPKGAKKEFWWEREWRHVGDFHLPATFIVLAPSADHAEMDGVVNSLRGRL